MLNVVVQGLGFVGSAMAVAVASRIDSRGCPLFNVIGIDLPDERGRQRIRALKSGKFPFKNNDKKLSDELRKAVERGNLTASYNKTAYSIANVVLVSINCDLIQDKSDPKIDLISFSNSLKIVSENISEETLVIIQSTVPPGTCCEIIYPMFMESFIERKLDIHKLYLAHSYERVMPGKKYLDSIINYWRVFAGINELSAEKCNDFLSTVINVVDYPLTKLSCTTASETAKLLENSYRAVNIAFMEEWGRFAEEAGIDLYEVINAIRLRPTHSNIRQPGFGVGGYCLTKDPLFAKIGAKSILNMKEHNFVFSTNAVQVNSKMPLVTLQKLKDYFNHDLKEKKILLLGAAYRQDVSDTRCSPSEIFCKKAKSYGAKVSIYDPMIEYWNELELELESVLPSAKDYDVVVFAVPHKEFTEISMGNWLKSCKALIFDANNVLTKKQIAEIKKYKLDYMSIGRG